jgi:hypothetical protein
VRPRIVPGNSQAPEQPNGPARQVPIIGCVHERYTVQPKGGALLPNGQRRIHIAVCCTACGAPYTFVALPFGGGAATVFRAEVLTVIAEIGDNPNQTTQPPQPQGEAPCEPPPPPQS